MAAFWLQFLLTIDATLRVATPLIFCAMAGIFSERAGIIDISLEGKMLMSAFVAATLAAVVGSPWVALGGGVMVSVAFSLIHGFACITHRGNQVVSGLALNMLASGLTVVLGIAFFAQGGQTPYLTGGMRFQPLDLPFAALLREVPVVGVVYAEVISGHNILVWAGLLSVLVTFFVIMRTRFGLRLRAVGEKPEAVDTAGMSVILLRYQAVIIAGVLCGFAGAYLSVAHGAGFGREMTAGKGYIALAAMIFGNWRPLGALFACLMFGFLDAVAARIQGLEVPFFGVLSGDLILALPYILTVIFLAGFIGRASPPAMLGVAYIKER